MMTSPRSGSTIPTGNHPGNTGGKPGRSGRPSNSFKELLAVLRADPEVHTAIEKAAKDCSGPGFRVAIALMERYDEEKPTEKGELKVTGLEDLLARSWSGGHA